MNVDRLVHLATPSVRYTLLSVHYMKVAGVGLSRFVLFSPVERLLSD